MAPRFPEQAVRCDIGDYLVRSDADGWHAARVQDVVALERLVVLSRGDEPVDLVPESPDSVEPSYSGPYLLLRTYERRFGDAELAAEAIRGDALGTGIDGVCRALASFPADTTRVIRHRPPDAAT